ncbi:MAG TPA: hypothetical protein PKY66_05580, partial [Thermoflexales bacterium]|nr:hypothetical protein [Thermoflexales bacterium]
ARVSRNRLPGMASDQGRQSSSLISLVFTTKAQRHKEASISFVPLCLCGENLTPSGINPKFPNQNAPAIPARKFI